MLHKPTPIGDKEKVGLDLFLRVVLPYDYLCREMR